MASIPKVSIISSILLFFSLISMLVAFTISITTYNCNYNHNLSSPQTDVEVMCIFESWVIKYYKNYKNIEEKEKRYQIFKENLKFINEHNSNNGQNLKLGLNKFADLKNNEFKLVCFGKNKKMSVFTTFKKKKVKSDHYLLKEGDLLPKSVDWRKKVDAFEFIVDNGGIGTGSYNPYKGTYDTCDQPKKNDKVFKIDEYEEFPEINEKELHEAVVHQPVSVAIEAGGATFQFYQSGVFTGKCGTNLDHEVTIVGYGSEKEKDYWIIESYLGSDWGEDGYIRMARNVKNMETGICGVSIKVSYPIKIIQNPPSPSDRTPPSPPSRCDSNYSCPSGTRCCCNFHHQEHCLEWGCCLRAYSVCCEGQYGCCPPDFPSCRMDYRCYKSRTSAMFVYQMQRLPANRNHRL